MHPQDSTVPQMKKPYPKDRKGSTPMMERVCEYCGNTFFARASRIAKGLGKYCSRACYEGFRRDNPLPLADRYWSKVQITPGCWLWLGALHGDGYGYVIWEGHQLLAHRASYLIHFGAIPDGLGVLHRCDNPPCTNPAHLFLGTNVDNMADMVSKGRGRNRPRLGEESPQARLTEVAIREIRDPATFGLPLAVLAHRYGVTKSAICDVRKRRTWAHLP